MASTYCGDDEVVKEVSGSGQLKLIESWKGYKIVVKDRANIKEKKYGARVLIKQI